MTYLNGTHPNSPIPIILLNYEGLSNEEMLEELRKLRTVMLNAISGQQFITLSNFTNCRTFSAFLKESELYAREVFNSRTYRSAMYGLNGITRIAGTLYNAAHGSYVKIFESKIDALNYLIK